jgi:ribosomal protein S18 acetylase RimI-like enzyme
MKIIKISRFSKQVFEAVLKLLPQLTPDEHLPERQYFKNMLRSHNIHFFIAELDNKHIVGMLTLVTYDITTGKKIWIEDVVVDESQRGKGIGKELVKFAIAYSKSLGAESVALTSRPSRAEANELYKKIGFVLHETNMYKYWLR